MSHTGTIKIPVLFDMSGDTIVYGEDVTGDFVTSHLDFILDMTTEANGISLNAANISDAIKVGDQDNTDNLFYSGGADGNIAVDNLCNRLSKAITRGKLVHIPKSGNHSNSGIPLGGRAELVDATGTHTIYHIQNEYTQKYFTSVAPIGDEQMLGQAMARVASIHLVGTPLAAAAFENKNSVQAYLETASAQTFNSGNTAFYNALAVQLSKVLGGSKSSAPMKPAGNPIAVYSTPGSAAYDVNKAITSRLDAAGETAFYTDANLIASVKTVSGNANATLQASVQVIAANHPNAENFPRGYFILANMNSATNNIYEPYWNESTTSTATGMPIGFTYDDGAHYGWGVIQELSPPKTLDTNGTSVPALKSIYEQLMSVPGRSQIMATRDVSPDTVAYSTPGSAAYDVNKAITSRLDAAGETAFYTDANLIASVKTVSGNANATLQASVQVIAANHPNAENFPRGYFILANMNSATNNIYEPYWNESTTSTATGMPIGFTYDDGAHYGWGVIQDKPSATAAGGFPFISGDKLVMYLRPKIVFAAQTKAEQSTSLITFSEGITLNTPVFNVGRDGQGITGQAYSESSVYTAPYGASEAFEGTVSGGYGYLGSTNFDNNTGAYNKTPPDNTSVDGSNLAGEWIQVNVGKKVAVTSYKIYPQNWEKHSIGGRSPHIFKLVYSDDGTNFLTADSQTVGTDNQDTSEWASDNTNGATYIPKTFTLTETKIGQYWRLVVTSLYGNGHSNGGTLSIQELEIKGTDDYTEPGGSSGMDLSGVETNIVATAENIEDAFPGNATTGPEPEMNKWGWMGSPSSDSLTLETTDVTDIRTIDLHIWKITITL